MIGLWIALVFVGVILAVVGVFSVIGGLANTYDPVCSDDMQIGPVMLGVGSLVLILGIVLSIFAFNKANDIDRQQCEEAGYEWITGTCYGVNVNVNGGQG